MSWFTKQKPNAHEWRKSKPPNPTYQGLGTTWSYVDLVTGRLDDGTVTKRTDESYFIVWVRGASYGHFDTFDNAKAMVEKICKDRGIA
jgi:hypothetical protein